MLRPPTNADSHLASCYHCAVSGQDDNNLLNFIATTVESMRQRIDTISDQMGTKVDLANLRDEMATLKDQMATKDDLARIESSLREQMASKEDLVRVESPLETMREQMATKDDLSRLATTVRGAFEQVHFRFDTLERVMSTRFGQVETDNSRLRSRGPSPG